MGGDYHARYGHHRSGLMEPFADVLPVFQAADLRIGNLEDPLYRSKAPRNKKNLLGSPPEVVEVLDELGFSVLNLANNHITDQGAEGIARTREILAARGIASFGAGADLEQAAAPAVVRVGDMSFAFLGYAEPRQDVGAEAATDTRAGCVPLSLDRMIQDIAAARPQASHVVVSLHWGYQYDRYPAPEQVSLARRLIDAGALIVFGHHPHVVQGMERYKSGLILYSLGNFFFPDFVRTDGVKWRFPSESCRTVAIRCHVNADGVQSAVPVPVIVGRHHRLRVPSGRPAARAIRSFERLSQALDEPEYESFWRVHHQRTEVRRRRQEKRLQSRAEVARLGRRVRTEGVTGTLKSVKGRSVKEIARILIRFVKPGCF